MMMRTPRDEFWNRERVDIIHKLFDDQVIRDAEIGGRESQFRKRKIKTIHTERDLVPQLAEISLFEAGTIPNNESASTFMNILPRGKAPDALPPPRMQIGRR